MTDLEPANNREEPTRVEWNLPELRGDLPITNFQIDWNLPAYKNYQKFWLSNCTNKGLFNIIKYPYFFRFNHFLDARAEIRKIFYWFFGELKTPQLFFEDSQYLGM